MAMLINIEPCWQEMKHIQGIGTLPISNPLINFIKKKMELNSN